jgi:hypothetical protein
LIRDLLSKLLVHQFLLIERQREPVSATHGDMRGNQKDSSGSILGKSFAELVCFGVVQAGIFGDGRALRSRYREIEQ